MPSNVGRALQGLGQTLVGTSGLLIQSQQLKQQAEENKLNADFAREKLAEAKASKADRFLKLALSTKNINTTRKLLSSETGQGAFKDLFGGYNEDLVTLLTDDSNKQLYIEASDVFQKGKSLGFDSQEYRNSLTSLLRSGGDPALVISNLKNLADLDKTITEASSPFGDPKFAAQQGLEAAKLDINRAGDLVKRVNDQYNRLLEVESNIQLAQSPEGQNRVLKNAISAAGVDLNQYQNALNLSQADPLSLASQRSKSKTGQFIQNKSPEPTQTLRQDNVSFEPPLPRKEKPKINAEAAGRFSLVKSQAQDSIEQLVNFANDENFNNLIGSASAKAKSKIDPNIRRSINSLKLALGFTLSGANVAKGEEKSILESIEPSLFDSKESYLSALKNANAYINEYISAVDVSMSDEEKTRLVRDLAKRFNLTKSLDNSQRSSLEKFKNGDIVEQNGIRYKVVGNNFMEIK